MGKMAPQTGFFLERRVNHGFVELAALMAAEAQVVAGRVEQMRLIRGMGIMAIGALAFFQCRMGVFPVHADLPGLMAGQTEPVALFL